MEATSDPTPPSADGVDGVAPHAPTDTNAQLAESERVGDGCVPLSDSECTAVVNGVRVLDMFLARDRR